MSNKEETALVPKRRFPEFRDAGPWKPVSLGEATTSVTERVGEKKLTPVSISAGVGFLAQSDKFGRDISGKQYQLYTVVRDGDFVYNKGNSLKFPEGCVYLLQGWGQVAAPNVFICFRFKEGFSNGFFQNCFEANAHGKQLKKHITSGARSNGLLNISKEDFYGIEIPTPSPAEQKKIAVCVHLLDELITAQARKVEALKTYKNGLQQQLFPCEDSAQPKLRFPEFRYAREWSIHPFDHFVRRSFYGTSRPTSETGQYPVLRMGNMLNGGLNFARLAYIDLDKKSFEKIRLMPGDILLNRTNSAALVGKISMFDQEIDCITASYIVTYRIDKDRIIPAFCNLMLNTPQYQKKISALARPSISQVNINPTLFRKQLVVSVPSLAEQQRIANCLVSLDTLIASAIQELASLNTHRTGLRQQLFPFGGTLEA